MSDKDGSQRSSASSSAIKKERNTPQPNKSMTPVSRNKSWSTQILVLRRCHQGGPSGLPPGLGGGRLPRW